MNLRYPVAALALIVSASTSCAGSYSPSCPQAVVPCKTQAWDFGLEAAYLRPVNADLGYQEDVSVSGQPTLPSVTRYIKPDFHFSGRVIGSYHFGNGNDITFHYSRFRDKKSASAHSTLDGGFIGEEGVTVTTTFGGVEWKYDSFAVEFGQKLKLGSDTTFRFHAGGEYARIFSRLSTTNGGGSLLEVLLTDEAPNAKQSEFKGFGGRFGLDAYHKLNKRFYLVAHGSAGLLAGNMNLFVRTGEPFTTDTNTDSHDEFQTFVPTYEVRGGMMYKYYTSTGKIKLELGYQAHGYGGAVIHGQDGVYSFDDDRNHISGFGVHGPYLQFKYIGKS